MSSPPFSAGFASTARLRLGMSHTQVAEQLGIFGIPVESDLVGAWESGLLRPTESQLFALADVLWCHTAELMGIEEPRSLAELRLSRQLTVMGLAARIDMTVTTYEQAERQNRWQGTRQQTLTLLNVLNVSLSQLLAVTGRTGEHEPAGGSLARPSRRHRGTPIPTSQAEVGRD